MTKENLIRNDGSISKPENLLFLTGKDFAKVDNVREYSKRVSRE